jgi:Na+/proline symporter
MIDFYGRFVDARAASVRVSRIATIAFGLTGTLLAMNVSKIGTLLEIANKLINAFSGPLFGIYLLAMFSRRATSGAVLIGGLAGTFVSYYVAYHTAIGFMWPSTFGLVATLAGGWTMSLFSAPRANRPQGLQPDLTWYGVMTERGTEATTWR